MEGVDNMQNCTIESIQSGLAGVTESSVGYSVVEAKVIDEKRNEVYYIYMDPLASPVVYSDNKSHYKKEIEQEYDESDNDLDVYSYRDYELFYKSLGDDEAFMADDKLAELLAYVSTLDGEEAMKYISSVIGQEINVIEIPHCFFK